MLGLDGFLQDGKPVTVLQGPEDKPGHLRFLQEHAPSPMEARAVARILRRHELEVCFSNVRISHVACARCALFLGCHVACDSSPVPTRSTSSTQGARAVSRAQKLRAVFSTHIAASYLRMPEASAAVGPELQPDVRGLLQLKPPPEVPLVCSGAGAIGGSCGAVLTWHSAVLSRRHCWDAGRGRELAWYVNHLRKGSVVVRNECKKMLAQGPMIVGDVFCSACNTQIGWKFVQDLGAQQNFCQVGRFGLVLSSFGRASLATAQASRPADSDDLESGNEEASESTASAGDVEVAGSHIDVELV